MDYCTTPCIINVSYRLGYDFMLTRRAFGLLGYNVKIDEYRIPNDFFLSWKNLRMILSCDL